MFGAIIAAVAGAVIGGAVNGAVAYKTTQDKSKAYSKAAEDVKAAAEKLKINKREIYDALVYSHTLALKFAQEQRKSFSDFETTYINYDR